MPGHYGSHQHNLVSVSSPVATQLLHAVGIALAAKIRKTGQVAMTSMGEGSSNQGDVHEGLNFAAIHKLPFVFVVENNGYAISVPAAMEVSVEDVADRASGYGIPGVVVDGADVLACYSAARDAVARARAGDGPTLIEAKVTRLTGHSSDDQQTKYRTEEDLESGREQDALPRFRQQLRDAGVLTDEIETRSWELMKKVEELGGSVNALEFIQKEIEESAISYQERYRTGQDVVVGVNKYVTDVVDDVDILKVDPESERRQLERLKKWKANRDQEEVDRRLEELRDVARGDANLLHPIKEALRSGGSIGEVCNAMRDVFGEYRGGAFF
jgi:TPP-dependent pyruvate/acetoin dehydrogenase alpha subunit